MSDAPIAIPGNRLAPVARQAASTGKTYAALACFLFAGFLVIFAAMLIRGELGLRLAIAAPLELVLGVMAVRWMGLARRASTVAVLAERAQGYQFLLAGLEVQVHDATGADRRELAFTIRESQRLALLAIPQATVRSG